MKHKKYSLLTHSPGILLHHDYQGYSGHLHLLCLYGENTIKGVPAFLLANLHHSGSVVYSNLKCAIVGIFIPQELWQMLPDWGFISCLVI